MNTNNPIGTDKYEAIRALQLLDEQDVSITGLYPKMPPPPADEVHVPGEMFFKPQV